MLFVYQCYSDVRLPFTVMGTVMGTSEDIVVTSDDFAVLTPVIETCLNYLHVHENRQLSSKNSIIQWSDEKIILTVIHL